MNRRIHRVRTTSWPWKVIEVDDATYTDLSRRGQLLPVEPEAPAEPVADEPPPADDETAAEPAEAPAESPRLRRRRTEHPD